MENSENMSVEENAEELSSEQSENPVQNENICTDAEGSDPPISTTENQDAGTMAEAESMEQDETESLGSAGWNPERTFTKVRRIVKTITLINDRGCVVPLGAILDSHLECADEKIPLTLTLEVGEEFVAVLDITKPQGQIVVNVRIKVDRNKMQLQYMDDEKESVITLQVKVQQLINNTWISNVYGLTSNDSKDLIISTDYYTHASIIKMDIELTILETMFWDEELQNSLRGDTEEQEAPEEPEKSSVNIGIHVELKKNFDLDETMKAFINQSGAQKPKINFLEIDGEHFPLQDMKTMLYMNNEFKFIKKPELPEDEITLNQNKDFALDMVVKGDYPMENIKMVVIIKDGGAEAAPSTSSAENPAQIALGPRIHAVKLAIEENSRVEALNDRQPYSQIKAAGVKTRFQVIELSKSGASLDLTIKKDLDQMDQESSQEEMQDEKLVVFVLVELINRNSDLFMVILNRLGETVPAVQPSAEEEMPQSSTEGEIPQSSTEKEKPQSSAEEKMPQSSDEKEILQSSADEEMPQSPAPEGIQEAPEKLPGKKEELPLDDAVMKNIVYVAGGGVDEKFIQSNFNTGNILQIKMLKKSGRALVTYENEAEAAEAIRLYNEKEIGNIKLQVSWARDQLTYGKFKELLQRVKEKSTPTSKLGKTLRKKKRSQK